MTLTAFGMWLSNASLMLVAGILVTIVGASLLIGWFARSRVRNALESDSLLTSSVLGLLALLLSFTFSLATDRYDARRILVQDEANAIGTAYLRAQLLDEPHRTRISQILTTYTDNRIALAEARPSEAGPLLATNDRLLNDFWSASAAAYPSIRAYDFSSSFYESVNLVIDLDSTRKSARQARVPPVVFILLFVYVSASAAMLGFVALTPRRLFQAAFFLCLLVMFLLVIIDIDQPTLGGIRESQAPMERLRASFTAN